MAEKNIFRRLFRRILRPSRDFPKIPTIEIHPESRKLFEHAVDEAQFLVAHATSKCEKKINKKIIQPLIDAKHSVDNKEPVDTETEVKFWMAYQQIWTLVKPATADSIMANKASGKSKARGTVKQYIFLTGLILVFLLVFQIHWVIGNQLTTQLTDLLKKENEKTAEISKNREEYDAHRITFMEKEMKVSNSGDNSTSNSGSIYHYFTFYKSPEWARETSQIDAEYELLKNELDSIEAQLEKNVSFLKAWSEKWKWIIDTGDNKKDSNFKIERFKTILAAKFPLVVLQSYLLPLLYGLLGAATSVLRSESKPIASVTYSNIQPMLRISLGGLAGIMVGGFGFLIPGETKTFLGTVSPLAIAFLVGYNIDLFFSLMDLAIDKVKIPPPEKPQENKGKTGTTKGEAGTNSDSSQPAGVSRSG